MWRRLRLPRGLHPAPLQLFSNLNGHDARRYGKYDHRFCCAICGGKAASRTGLRMAPCSGVPRLARSAHSTHVLWTGRGGIVWCRQCGAYGSMRSKHLFELCHKGPRNKGASQSLAHLKKGVDPSTRTSFGKSGPAPPRQL
eukprot:1655306-Pyramimonas_sp.AAC.1